MKKAQYIQEDVIKQLSQGVQFNELYKQDETMGDDEVVMSAAIYQNVKNFAYASHRLRQDIDFILSIVDRGAKEEYLLDYADPSVLHDERILYGLTVDELTHIYRYLGLPLRLKPEVSQIALVGENYRQNLKFVPEQLWEDADFALRAVLIHGALLHEVPQVSKKYWGIPEFWWAAVRSEGLMLKHAFYEYREDYDFVLTAIQQNGKSLKYASSKLRDDEKIVKIAMKNEPMAWRYATERVQQLLAK
ncbi:MAG: DUF4116 domain-containing protein [Culicoidibacterales bacterium]